MNEKKIIIIIITMMAFFMVISNKEGFFEILMKGITEIIIINYINQINKAN